MIFYYHMYGSGFTETLDNPSPGKLQLQMRLSTRTITIWEQSADMGNEWQLANVYIGMGLGDVIQPLSRDDCRKLPGNFLVKLLKGVCAHFASPHFWGRERITILM